MLAGRQRLICSERGGREPNSPEVPGFTPGQPRRRPKTLRDAVEMIESLRPRTPPRTSHRTQIDSHRRHTRIGWSPRDIQRNYRASSVLPPIPCLALSLRCGCIWFAHSARGQVLAWAEEIGGGEPLRLYYHRRHELPDKESFSFMMRLSDPVIFLVVADPDECQRRIEKRKRLRIGVRE